VRLRPVITVGGVVAEGPTLLLSSSIEQYVANVPIGLFGGVVRAPVSAETDTGLVRQVNLTRVVIPWGLLGIIVISAGIIIIIVRWWRRRVGRIAGLHADIRRLERLVTHDQPVPTPDAIGAPTDEALALTSALKRARRSAEWDAFAKLALAYHHATSDGLDPLLESLERGAGERRTAVIDAAVSYGFDALVDQHRYAGLPGDVLADLHTTLAGGLVAKRSTPKAASRR